LRRAAEYVIQFIMPNDLRASLIVVAAGSGVRLGATVPKAFVEVGGVPVLALTLRTVGALSSIGEVVITTPAGWERAAREQAAAAGLKIPVKIMAGGAERQDSVRTALSVTSAEAQIVVVHDAARPFATAEMFEACLERAAACGAAIVAIPLADTLKRVEQGTVRETIPRAGLWQAQTPQAFWRALLVRAHEEAVQQKLVATDDADLVERLGAPVAIVEGSPANLKITTPEDLELAEALMMARYPR
jgi:2-C-methyl-D-erythritol 4-phosphate cytidylyltransferase